MIQPENGDMKKVIKPHQYEEAEFYCDRHPDRQCFSSLKTNSWYGSQFDMTGVEIHLCDECLGVLYKLLEQLFGVKPQDKDLI